MSILNIKIIKKNINKTHKAIIKISRTVKSIGNLSWSLTVIPKTTLNQHFEKPIKPKKLTP